MSSNTRLIHSIRTQTQGSLHFFEARKDIPFDIKRIYYVVDAPAGAERGGHAHKKLQQFLFCPYGKVEIKLDDGEKTESILLDRPDKGLILTPCVWREMIWIKDASVLCVAVSDYYNENDYIRDYQDFIQHVKENR